MPGEAVAVIVMFLIIGACIIIPFWLRHRLYYKQLDTLASMIEKGADPEKIARSLEIKTARGDVNGNWKAGLIIFGVGATIFLLGLPGARLEGFVNEWLTALVIPVLGLLLIIVHFTIVGRVVKHPHKTAPDE